MSLNMNKLSFSNAILHPAFLASHYLYMADDALHSYWKHSNLE